MIESSTHYLGFGLSYAPTSDDSSLVDLGSVTYGQRRGIEHARTCQVVSRWADPTGGGDDVTVFADIALAGPVSR